MLYTGFNDVNILDLTIAGQIIMWFFVAIAVVAFLIFLFNLIFVRPGSWNKKEVDPNVVSQRQEFDQQVADVEIEIALILKVEDERNLELQQKEGEIING